MKRILISSFLSLGALLLVGGLPAFGMVSGGIKASIPFDFRVGETTLPAGEYLIASPDSDMPNMLEIRNVKGAPAVLVLTEPVSPKPGAADKTELEFKHVGNQEYLCRVWESTIEVGNQVPEPSISDNSAMHQPAHEVNVQTLPAKKS